MTLDSRSVRSTQSHVTAQANRIAALVGFASFLFGLCASVGVLNGDELGRVNLLYALLFFALAPAIFLVVTLVLMASGRRKGIMSLLLGLRLVPRQFRDSLSNLPSAARRSAQLFYSSQLVTLAFALGSLFGFILLLLATDISFVWRSTLLDAAAMLPLLDILATPWRFWPEAQPTLEMLKLTQDFRLAPTPSDAAYVGQWWRYLLTAQLCYNLLPRSVLIIAARLRLRRQSVSAPSQRTARDSATSIDLDPGLAPVNTSAPTGATLIDWAHLPPNVGRVLTQRLVASELIRADAARDSLSEAAAASWPAVVIVLVRSWEPPLGELADFIAASPASTTCLIAPLDWRDDRLVAPADKHSVEWRRFCAELTSCQYLALCEKEQL